MEFQIISRKIEVKAGHFVQAIGLFFALAMLDVIIISSATFIMDKGAFDLKVFNGFESMASEIIRIIGYPILAYSYVWIAGKEEKNASFARSMAAAMSIGTIFLLLLLTIFVAFFMPGALPQTQILITIESAFAFCVTGMVIYLWMLYFLKPDDARLKDVAPYGAATAIVIFLITQGIYFTIDYSHGTAYTPSFGLGTMSTVMFNFLLGLIILYHTRDRKLDMDAAYLFSGLFLGARLLLLASRSIVAGSLDTIGIVDIAVGAAFLCLLYLFSNQKKDV